MWMHHYDPPAQHCEHRLGNEHNFLFSIGLHVRSAISSEAG
jgi:hypothetical protein